MCTTCSSIHGTGNQTRITLNAYVSLIKDVQSLRASAESTFRLSADGAPGLATMDGMFSCCGNQQAVIADDVAVAPDTATTDTTAQARPGAGQSSRA